MTLTDRSEENLAAFVSKSQLDVIPGLVEQARTDIRVVVVLPKVSRLLERDAYTALYICVKTVLYLYSRVRRHSPSCSRTRMTYIS